MHYLHLNHLPLQRIKQGTKTIEFRLNDKKRKGIQAWDTLHFSLRLGEESTLVATVSCRYDAHNFTELLYTKIWKPIMEIDPLYNNYDELIVSFDEYYSPEMIQQYWVVGFELSISEEN